MGMFDYITNVPEVKCRKCGEPVTGWQSKDGGCFLRHVPFWTVENFYTSCKCGQWHEFVRKTLMPPPPEVPFTDYELLPEDLKYG